MKFWDYTPFEINLLIEKYIEDKKEKAKSIITLAWYTEAFARQKTLSDLEEILKDKKEKKEMTSEDMLEEIKKLNAQLGGETY